jgi:2-polyprenyl-3-methyl-5-hydroxy-6-metoxy-1,4-benzoquinol methylase
MYPIKKLVSILPSRYATDARNLFRRNRPPFIWAKQLSNNDWARTLGEGQGPKGETLPPNPPDDVQSMYVGAIGYSAYLEGVLFIDKMKKELAGQGFNLQPATQVLDCGVGWGRMYRALLRDIHPNFLLGIDIDADMISLCRQTMPYGRFELVNRQPPYAILKATFFDLVYLYSVFSHLNEPAFRSMMRELVRILKPGGYLVFTTLKEAHLSVWNQGLSRAGIDKVLQSVNFDFYNWQQRAKEGEFLHVPTGGGHESRPAEYFGETILTKKYLNSVDKELGFKMLIFDEPTNLPQSFVMMQRL